MVRGGTDGVRPDAALPAGGNRRVVPRDPGPGTLRIRLHGGVRPRHGEGCRAGLAPVHGLGRRRQRAGDEPDRHPVSQWHWRAGRQGPGRGHVPPRGRGKFGGRTVQSRRGLPLRLVPRAGHGTGGWVLSPLRRAGLFWRTIRARPELRERHRRRRRSGGGDGLVPSGRRRRQRRCDGRHRVCVSHREAGGDRGRSGGGTLVPRGGGAGPQRGAHRPGARAARRHDGAAAR